MDLKAITKDIDADPITSEGIVTVDQRVQDGLAERLTRIFIVIKPRRSAQFHGVQQTGGEPVLNRRELRRDRSVYLPRQKALSHRRAGVAHHSDTRLMQEALRPFAH